MAKLLIAMSGGVDSSVAALLTMRSGDACAGCTMHLFDNGDAGISGESTCCSLDDVWDARSVCRRLGIAHHTFNYKREFRDCVMAPFAATYESGGTPNPCIECNRCLKFGALLERAALLGFDGVVSGHYARIERDEKTGRYLLKKAVDAQKDQTYVLYMLRQEQLARIRFPLGTLTKQAVREIAEKEGFLNAKKRDSQDICFVPDGDYGAFLERFTGKAYPPGDYVSPEGEILGRHRGAVRYTIGQRKGLGIALGHPAYVLGKDMEKNTVTVSCDESRLFSRRVTLFGCNWIAMGEQSGQMRVEAKLRYSHGASPATLTWDGDAAELVFDAPQRAVTPGQAAVCYAGDLVVGGGTIERAQAE